MKLFYIANARLPTEKAHGIQIFAMCEAFAKAGNEVTLVVPSRRTPIKEDPFEYFHTEKIFKIKKLWCLDLVSLGRGGFMVESLTFLVSVLVYTVFCKGIFYTRDELIAVLLKIFGKQVAWEAHRGGKNVLVKKVIHSEMPLVTISQGLKDLYLHLGAKPEKILVAPDGVKLEEFNISESLSEARIKLGFDPKGKLALYTGHLYSWKGADILALAAQKISPKITIAFVGGTDNDIESFKKKYGSTINIKILGKQPHRDISLYLRSADILILPNSAREDISRLYTSPMKLFEYMASGTPIVASDLPSLREVLSEETAYFFKPDDAKSLAEVIGAALNDTEASKKAEKALALARNYTWKHRAENILHFIQA